MAPLCATSLPLYTSGCAYPRVYNGGIYLRVCTRVYMVGIYLRVYVPGCTWWVYLRVGIARYTMVGMPVCHP